MCNVRHLVIRENSKNGLVFIENNRIITDSLTIAEVFEKGHDKVLRDIRALKCSEKFRKENFWQSTYINKQGRKMPCYILTEKGFAMIAMGYTGEKAVQFKELFIEEFERMRKILENQKITLLSFEQKEIQAAIRQRIYSLYPSISNQARRKYFSRLYKDLKTKFSVTSFRDIRRCDLDKALFFISHWNSKQSLFNHPTTRFPLTRG